MAELKLKLNESRRLDREAVKQEEGKGEKPFYDPYSGLKKAAYAKHMAGKDFKYNTWDREKKLIIGKSSKAEVERRLTWERAENNQRNRKEISTDNDVVVGNGRRARKDRQGLIDDAKRRKGKEKVKDIYKNLIAGREESNYRDEERYKEQDLQKKYEDKPKKLTKKLEKAKEKFKKDLPSVEHNAKVMADKNVDSYLAKLKQPMIKQDKKPLEQRGQKALSVLESFRELSDYELYQLLEANGYNPSKENLYVLKEGLINGDIELLDESRRLDREATKKVLNSKKPIHSHTYDVSGVLASFHKHQLGANAAKEGTPEAIEFAKEYGKFDKKQADEAIEAEQNTKEVSPERLARQLKIKKKVKDQQWRNEFNEYRDNDNPEITFKRSNKQIFR